MTAHDVPLSILRSLSSPSLACVDSFFGRRGTRARGAAARGTFRLTRQRFSRRRPTALTLQCAPRSPRAPARRFSPPAFATLGEIAPGLPLGSRFAALGRRQFHAGPPRFRQPDRNRLRGRARPMFAFPNMLHLFAHELAGLSRRRQTFPFIFACPFNCFVFWHNKSVSLATFALDVNRVVAWRRPALKLSSRYIPYHANHGRDSPAQTQIQRH